MDGVSTPTVHEISDAEPEDLPECNNEQPDAAASKRANRGPLQVRVNFLKDMAGYCMGSRDFEMFTCNYT